MEKHFLLTHGSSKTPVILQVPDGMPVQRVVLGVHGIGGSSQDPIQSGIAEEMTMFSCASVRFDFPCHGENPGNTMSVAGCVDSLMAVAGWIRQNFPHVEDLCIFASGFGAYLTLLSLQDLLELPGRIRLVVQTPSVLMHQTILSMKKLTPETLRVMDRVNFAAPRPFDLTYRFYNQLRQNIALTTYPIPMLILQGEEDDYIRADDIQQFHRINEDAKLVTIPGTSHRFLEEGAWDMVLDLTRDWFEYEQVLLTDWD